MFTSMGSLPSVATFDNKWHKVIVNKADKMATVKRIRSLDGKTRTLSPSSYKWLYPNYDPEDGFTTQIQKQMRREHGLPTDTVSEELLIRLLDGVDRFARARGIKEIAQQLPSEIEPIIEEGSRAFRHTVYVGSSTEVILRSLKEGLRFLLLTKDRAVRAWLLKWFAWPADRELLWYAPSVLTDEPYGLLSTKPDVHAGLFQRGVALKDGKVAPVMFKTKRLSCYVRAFWKQDEHAVRRLRVMLYFTADFTHWAFISLNYRTRPDRGKMPKWIKRKFFPYHDKRVNLPTGENQEQTGDVWVNDAFAIICLYLLQEKFVDLDVHQEIKEFLLQHLGGFKGAHEIGVLNLLEHLRQHYRLSEDYRAWRKYVSLTIRGLIATQKKQQKSSLVGYVTANPDEEVAENLARENLRDKDLSELMNLRGPTANTQENRWVANSLNLNVDHGRKILDPQSNQEFWLVPAAASQVGISERWLYHLIEEKKLQGKYIWCGAGRVLGIEPSQLDRLRVRIKEKHLRRKAIENLARRRGIDKGSARRWLKRHGE
jgi:hypothetical protein